MGRFLYYFIYYIIIYNVIYMHFYKLLPKYFKQHYLQFILNSYTKYNIGIKYIWNQKGGSLQQETIKYIDKNDKIYTFNFCMAY